MLKSKNKINLNYLFIILLAFLPISFIAGNLIINLNVILIIILTFLVFGSDLSKVKFTFLDKTILMFFLIVIFTGLYNDLIFFSKHEYLENYKTSLKSIFFFRYFLFYLSIKYLIEKKIIDLKLFFLSCLICSLFVCLDIFYQFLNGEDIFGYKMISDRRMSGPFGDELIAGGYLLRFSIIALFFIPIFYKNFHNNFVKIVTSLAILIFIIGIILSGNRMPLIMFVFTLGFITIMQKETRKYFIVLIASACIIFFTLLKFYTPAKYHFHSFYNDISKIIVSVKNRDFNNEKAPLYLQQFSSFYDTWLMNKYIGGGIKNFRFYCHLRPNVEKTSNFVCNMHPHNYYLEILTETGLLGMLVILIIFIQILFLGFYKKYFSEGSINQNMLITPFIFLFISEIFPLKSTGSFFTTNNTTYLFLILSIIIGIIKKDNLIEKRN